MLDRQAYDQAVDALRPTLVSLADRLHDSPELAFEEHRAAAWLGEAVEAEGWPVERALGGLPTAFRAAIGSGRPPELVAAVRREFEAR